MTPQKLKSSILQLAVQGKLVEQRPEEGTGEELYQQIQAEKQRLVKEGKIKKEKPLPGIAEDEVPFEIPESWKWVYFSELYSLSNGTASRGTEGGNERPVLRLADLSGNTIKTENVRKIFLSEREFLSHKVQKDDLIFVRVNGSKERVAIAFHYTAEETISYCDHLFCGHKCSSLIDVDYVMFAFNCWATRKQLVPEIKTTAGQNTISQTSMARILLPLPPLAEQKRIVARVEELLPYIDRYEKAWNRLKDFNRRFPADMQKSILQLAIQGKLVEQRPEEGIGEELYRQIQEEKRKLIRESKIKKEKPLPEIAEDEVPFNIPESWKWCKLSTLGVTQTGNTPSKAHPEYAGLDIPFITPGDILNGRISYDNQALSNIGKEVARVCCKESVLQVCIGGSIGKAAIADREVTFNQQINAISPIFCVSEYIFFVMQSAYFITTMKERAGGTATPIINRGLWDSLLIPLPPLAEQKRIVARLEEILSLCKRLDR